MAQTKPILNNIELDLETIPKIIPSDLLRQQAWVGKGFQMRLRINETRMIVSYSDNGIDVRKIISEGKMTSTNYLTFTLEGKLRSVFYTEDRDVSAETFNAASKVLNAALLNSGFLIQAGSQSSTDVAMEEESMKAFMRHPDVAAWILRKGMEKS